MDIGKEALKFGAVESIVKLKTPCFESLADIENIYSGDHLHEPEVRQLPSPIIVSNTPPLCILVKLVLLEFIFATLKSKNDNIYENENSWLASSY